MLPRCYGADLDASFLIQVGQTTYKVIDVGFCRAVDGELQSTSLTTDGGDMGNDALFLGLQEGAHGETSGFGWVCDVNVDHLVVVIGLSIIEEVRPFLAEALVAL